LVQQKHGSSSVSRREFGRRAALTGVVALLPSQLVAQTPHEVPGSGRAEHDETGPAEPSPAARDEIESRYQNVVRKWGQRLTPEQRRRLRSILTENERMLEPIRGFQLANADPPAPVLRFSGEETNRERPASDKATNARR
jgi:hypothetical protein